jgi:predicted nucleotidyltransferase
MILEEIGRIAGKFADVHTAYVYGSFLEIDDFRDIDVALLLCGDPPAYQALKLAMHIGSKLSEELAGCQDFDVRILNDAHPEFQYEVVKNGRAVYCRDKQERFDWEAEVISTYLDLKEMYDFFDKKYLGVA